MTLSKPPSPANMNSIFQQQLNDEKYKKIKRKLKETIELNETLSKGFLRAKKKIRILTFERNLLLDNIARMNHHYHDGQTSKNMSDDSDLISTSGNSSSSSSETEAPFAPQSLSKDKLRRVTNTKVTTVASAPPKRSKINRINIKTRRVQPIERDDQGQPILPQQIGVLTVLNLGKIISNRDTFHNERYIFPIGYTVRRTYPSMIDPSSNTVITSTIMDGGDGPRFHVVAADQPNEPIVANSATGAWTVVVRKSNEIRHREHSNSASGPDYYGFKHPTIAKMIQDLPGTRYLKNYVWQNFEEMEPRAAKGVMAAAEKKRDNLEQMGNANRKIVVSAVEVGYNSSNSSRMENTSNVYQRVDSDDEEEEEIDELGVSDNDRN